MKRFVCGLATAICIGLGPWPALSPEARTGESVLALDLPEALGLALDGGPSVTSARAQWRSAEARSDQARSGRFPQLTMSAGYTRYQQPSIVVPIHEAGIFPPLDENIHEGLAYLSVPLFDGGRRRATHRAAAASADEARAQRDLSEQQLIEAVTSLFVRSRALEDTGQLVAARLSALRQRQGELALLWPEGRVSPGDTAQVAAAMQSAVSDSLDVDAQQFEVAANLGALIGSTVDVRPITSTLGLQTPYDWHLEEMVEPPASTGPGVRAAQARLTRDRALKTEAAGRFWPNVVGFGTYSLRSGGDLDFSGEWAAGVRLQVPLFDAGSRTSGLRAARASVEAAEARARQAIQSQNAQVRISLDQWRTSKARRRHLGVAAGAKSVFVAAQQQLYREGRISLSELLTQESGLLQLQIQERSAAYSEVLAGLRYHSAAGSLTVGLIHSLSGSSS
jgi:outer membrane protein